MKDFLSYTVSFLLIIGTFFLTTDCEIYLKNVHSQYFADTIPTEKSLDVEHTHINHSIFSDILTGKAEHPILYLPVCNFKVLAINYFIKNPDQSPIFQPPKSKNLYS